MRPREFPAESLGYTVDGRIEYRASMRPREFPAESSVARMRSMRSIPGFNEAAGVPRGIHHQHPQHRRRLLASMRPREFPAESVACVMVPMMPLNGLQ